MRRPITLLMILCLIFPGGPAFSHHAVSMLYKPEAMVSVSGVVKEFRFHNPHCVIFLTRTNTRGEEELWTIEWAGSSALRRQGVKADSIRPGDQVTATGFPARDGSTQMALRILEFADGRPPINPPDRSGENE